jgi:hypothetical protein
MFFGNQLLINKSAVGKLIDHYGGVENWHNSNKETGDLGYGLVHYSLIRVTKPTKLLAVGSRYGFIPACMAVACRDNDMGRVDFVDPGYDQRNPKQTDHWGGMGFWKDIDFDSHFNKFRLKNYIEFFLMESSIYAEKYNNQEYDYVYLDGDHSYQGVKDDFDNFWPRLKKRGIMAFHDIYMKPTEKLNYGVYKLWEQLKNDNYNCISLPGKFGLGIIQK